MDDDDIGIINRRLVVEILVINDGPQIGKGIVEGGDSGAALIGLQIFTAPRSGGFERDGDMSPPQEIAHDPPQEMGIAVVPV